MYAFYKLSHKFFQEITPPQDLENKIFLMIHLQEPAFWQTFKSSVFTPPLYPGYIVSIRFLLNCELLKGNDCAAFLYLSYLALNTWSVILSHLMFFWLVATFNGGMTAGNTSTRTHARTH